MGVQQLCNSRCHTIHQLAVTVSVTFSLLAVKIFNLSFSEYDIYTIQSKDFKMLFSFGCFSLRCYLLRVCPFALPFWQSRYVHTFSTKLRGEKQNYQLKTICSQNVNPFSNFKQQVQVLTGNGSATADIQPNQRSRGSQQTAKWQSIKARRFGLVLVFHMYSWRFCGQSQSFLHTLRKCYRTTDSMFSVF